MGNEIVKRKIPTLAELTDEKALVQSARESKFLALLNEPPPQKFIKENKGVKYLPIEVVKYFLGGIYGSDYSIEQLREGIIANSVYVVVRITVTNPLTGKRQSHDGVGAVAIQLDKDSIPTDFTK